MGLALEHFALRVFPLGDPWLRQMHGAADNGMVCPGSCFLLKSLEITA